MSGRLNASENCERQLNDVGHGGSHLRAACFALDADVLKENTQLAVKHSILFQCVSKMFIVGQGGSTHSFIALLESPEEQFEVKVVLVRDVWQSEVRLLTGDFCQAPTAKLRQAKEDQLGVLDIYTSRTTTA